MNIIKTAYKKSFIPKIRGEMEVKKINKVNYDFTKKQLAKIGGKNIFYFGIPRHNNLGDLAQYVCIKKILNENYKDYSIIEIPSSLYYNNINDIRTDINLSIKEDDLIIFQSGYCTQDLGGYEDLVHKMVTRQFPNNKLVLMPQTVYFKSEDRKQDTSNALNNHNHLLFLARDQISFDSAKEMFPKINVQMYPDVVTTLIGKYNFSHERNDIMVCVRDDGEKFYSDSEISKLIKDLSTLGKVDKDDTTIKEQIDSSHPELQSVIESYIEKLSKYSVVITDRYHGTIFSLIANTPVIVIKTNDHKVVTGVDWFKGVYDDSVVYEDEISNVPKLVNTILTENRVCKNSSYFKEEYYDKLIDLIKTI